MIPTREELLEQLDRITNSEAFQASDNLKAFLRFVALKTVEGQEADLKEYTIATEVFGRDSSYDPRTDSLVRVQAGRLRSKLQEYYAGEGRNDRLLIDLPKGHYTVTFTLRPSAAVRGAPQKTISTRPYWIAIAVLALCSLVLLILVRNYRSQATRLEDLLSQTAFDLETRQLFSRFWQDFLDSPGPVLVAYSNTVFQGTPETGMKLLKPLDSSAHGFGSGVLQSAQTPPGAAITDHYTGVGEVSAVYSLGSVFWKMGRSLWVKRSLHLTWDDLKHNNIVILGSPAENLLLRSLPQKQDLVFRMVSNGLGEKRFAIADLRPQKGVAEHYFSRQEGPSSSQIVEDYALVSMLRGLDPDRKLLILAGIQTAGTQAAAEYVCRPEYVKELLDRLQTPSGLPPYFQVLLKVKVNGGIPVQIAYLTHHVLE